MICPKCQAEYRPEFTECPACRAPLVGARHEPMELVLVYQSGDMGRVMLAKNFLESAEIPYIVKNEEEQGLFGWGSIPFGYNLLIGPMEIRVYRQDVEAALDILKDLDDEGEEAEKAPKHSLPHVHPR